MKKPDATPAAPEDVPSSRKSKPKKSEPNNTWPEADDDEEVETINFGKKKGERLRDLARQDPGFLKWILKSDFASDTKDIIRKILDGKKIDPIGAGIADQLAALKDPDAE